MKHSIQKRIIIIFFAALTASVAVCAALILAVSYTSAVSESRSTTGSVAHIVQDMLDDVGFGALTDSENAALYADVRTRMRSLCEGFRLAYLYIYQIDPQTQARHFVMTVASGDEEDRVAAEKLGLGVVQDSVLHQQELDALSGVLSEERRIIDNEYGKVITWVAPYTDADGTVLALIGTDYDFTTWTISLLQLILAFTVPIALILLVSFLSLFDIIRRRVVTPVKTISARMERFDPQRERTMTPLEIKADDEIGGIAGSFNKMSADISRYLADIEVLTTERVESSVQIEVARRIQEGMVPAHTALSGSRFDVCGFARPAREVGGDFYDCVELADSRVCLVIGDVSGKGVTAAIFMAMVKTMIHEKLLAGLEPAQVLNQVCDQICESNPEGMFATVFLAVLNTATGELRCANAGHTSPLLIGADAAFLRPEPGIALGVFRDAGIKEDTLTLTDGQGLLLYTDGVTEAVDREKGFFGEDRLLRAAAGAKSATQAVAAVTDAVFAFEAGVAQFDDLTAVSLFYHAAPETAARRWQALPLSAEPFETLKAEVFRRVGSGAAAKKALLACDELVANLTAYSGATEAAFFCEQAEDKLLVGFSDNGVPFDPTRAAVAEKAFEDMDAGGMGLRLVRQIADEMRYRREDGKNILELTVSL